VRILATVISLILLPGIAVSQTNPNEKPNQQPSPTQNSTLNLFGTSRPDIEVVVTKHPTGADMFVVSALDANFSPDVLRQSLVTFGKLLGSDPRGLTLFTSNVKTMGTSNNLFLKAQFAVTGFWKVGKSVELQPLARAFAGISSKPKIKGIDVILDGGVATPAMLQSFSGSGAQVQAQAIGSPPAINYRIKLLSQDPSNITIPDSVEALDKTPLKTKESKKFSWSAILLALVLALTAGVLVYNLIVSNSMKRKGFNLK